MDSVDMMWLAVAVYLTVQSYALLRWKGGWRIAAAIPLLLMVPVIGITVYGFIQQSNLWPIFLLLAGPVALLYMLILTVVRMCATRR